MALSCSMETTGPVILLAVHVLVVSERHSWGGSGRGPEGGPLALAAAGMVDGPEALAFD